MDHSTLEAFLARLGAAFAQPVRLYLVGETSHVFEGWRERTERLEFAAEVVPDDRAAFNEAVRGIQAQMGIEILEQISPGFTAQAS